MTALVFLTEMGDLNPVHQSPGRWALLGPGADQLRERLARRLQGHITRQGPAPKCDAFLLPSHLVSSAARRSRSRRCTSGSRRRTRSTRRSRSWWRGMRRLGIRMWHAGRGERPRELKSCGSASGGGTRGPSSLPRTPTPPSLFPVCSGRSRKIQSRFASLAQANRGVISRRTRSLPVDARPEGCDCLCLGPTVRHEVLVRLQRFDKMISRSWADDRIANCTTSTPNPQNRTRTLDRQLPLSRHEEHKERRRES